MERIPKSLRYVLHGVMLTCAAVLLALHGVHLLADFPNHSPWMDWSKYTDEGWYGDAAIRHYLLGRWYVPGDFNPAAALPVWPLLEGVVFHFTGVSLTAARGLTVGVFAATLAACWWLLARGPVREQRAPLAGSAAVLLLAASPFCFVFTRLAILEPLLVLLTVVGLLLARSARVSSAGLLRANRRVILALGLLLPAAILTKTTAMFLLPAVAWMLFAALQYRWRALLKVGAPALGLGATIWGVYFLALVRPHFLLDFRYLFSANGYTGMTGSNFVQVLTNTFSDGMWMGPVLYPAALVAAGIALLQVERLREQPLVVSLLLWAGGYTAFLAYHNNLQPRYYLVVAVPLTLLVPLAMSKLVLEKARRRVSGGLLFLGAVAVVLAIAVPDAIQTIRYLRAPEYTLVRAAEEVQQTIEAGDAAMPGHSPLVLSISGSELSLMTGLQSIDDDFGTLELPDRVKKYRPGWYVAWNQIDDDKLDAMTPLFHLERVAAFPAMDDPDRNLLIVYRLDAAEPTPAPVRKGKPTPKELRVKVGEQPSTVQLEH